MSLALQQSHISQNDLISVNSIVRVSGASLLHIVKAISKDRKFACVVAEYDDGFAWWSLDDLVYVSDQGDFFDA